MTRKHHPVVYNVTIEDDDPCDSCGTWCQSVFELFDNGCVLVQDYGCYGESHELYDTPEIAYEHYGEPPELKRLLDFWNTRTP